MYIWKLDKSVRKLFCDVSFTLTRSSDRFSDDLQSRF